MEIVLRNREAVWRSIGRPKTEIPPEVTSLLHQTYKTGSVGEINMRSPEYNKDEAAELLRLLNLGARRMNRRLRVQVNEQRGIILFEMVDVGRRRS